MHWWSTFVLMRYDPCKMQMYRKENWTHTSQLAFCCLYNRVDGSPVFSPTQQGGRCVRKGLVMKSSLIDHLKTIWETCLQIAGGRPRHWVLGTVVPHSTEKLCGLCMDLIRVRKCKTFCFPWSEWFVTLSVVLF